MCGRTRPWSRSCAKLQSISDFQAIRETGGVTREGCRDAGAAIVDGTLLHPAYFRRTVIASRSIQDVEGVLVFVKPQFEIGRAGFVRVSRAPLDVEDSIGCAPRD